jgi:long-chain acyl-CoA synthetase
MNVMPTALFNWHKGARLFAGDVQIKRPVQGQAGPFQHIPAQPTTQTLSRLATALTNSNAFCISDEALPSDLSVETGDFVTLTGGSSGRPKFISRTQASWCASFAINAVTFAMTHSDVAAVFGRLSHSLALYGILEALHLGMDAYALDGMRPKTQCAKILRSNITVLYVTPTQLRMLTKHAGTTTMPAVRLILCGGGDLDQQTRLAAQVLCPNAAVHVFYGAAETSFITISDQNTPSGSVGQSYPGATINILDPNGVTTREVGEVWVKSPYLFKGYVSDGSAETKRKNGFVTVGEMGQMDADGNLWLRGRKTRMVTVADQNVFPEEVETFIATVPDVGLCAVIPVPDRARGNRLTAVVQGVPDPATATRIQGECRVKFGPLIAPSKVLFIANLPLLASGKPDLVTLTKWAKDQP